MESIDGKARISERKRRDTCAFVYGGFIRIRESPNGRGPCLIIGDTTFADRRRENPEF